MYANKIFFTFNGEYAGFDVNQPTSRTGGKAEAISMVRRALNDDANIIMIGDGATDQEACPPADYFIGYGGNIIRDEVRNRAHYYITDFEQLYHVLWMCYSVTTVLGSLMNLLYAWMWEMCVRLARGMWKAGGAKCVDANYTDVFILNKNWILIRYDTVFCLWVFKPIF